MNHETLRDLIPAFAVGALDDDERSALEKHLRGCDECRALLAEYRALGDDLLYAAPPMAARAGLTEALRRRIAAPARLKPRFSLAALLWRPAFGLTLAALAVVLLVGSNLYWAGRVARVEREVTAVATLVQAPAISLIADAGNPQGRGVLYGPADGNVALLCVYDLPLLPQEKTYQVWLITGQQRVSGGTFQVAGDGYGILLIRSPRLLREYDALGITVEPAGGSPGPTTPRVLGTEL